MLIPMQEKQRNTNMNEQKKEEKKTGVQMTDEEIYQALKKKSS